EQAYGWLATQQLGDGSWWASYGAHSTALCDSRETNFVAYIAVGVWHHYLITENIEFLRSHFPVVERAIDFVLRYQSRAGEIAWAVEANGTARDDALLTGCSSIYKSIRCALLIADELECKKPLWHNSARRLRDALLHKPERFDRNWESKARYSMDWFYPVLAGVYQGSAARARIDARWSEFVVDGMGCKCVSDEPWATVAESCELSMALLAIGDQKRAAHLFSWLHQFKHSDGGYWTGYVYPDEAIWPEERTSWTAGAVLLAADALSGHSGASQLFIEQASSTQFGRRRDPATG
ncbi:MAG: hypothetical protein WBN40_14275, partial [Pseudomonadales bacterium]